jgi:mannose-6-phosphate isomerase-like protein (cupin superfamily)
VNGIVRDAEQVPEHRSGNDSTSARELLDATVGCTAFTMRTLRAVRGRSFERGTGEAQELLFVVEGHGELICDDRQLALERHSGVLLAPGSRYEIDNASTIDLLLVSVSLHDPLGGAPAPTGPSVSRLADHAAQSATGDRSFRIVFDPSGGCASATAFVGEIPVGAAPRHYHLYEEVIYVLEGEGVMHMNDRATPVRAGSVIHLPAQRLHTLENSDPSVMAVLGVFRPAGSPAAAFYPDGTPAYAGDQDRATAATR